MVGEGVGWWVRGGVVSERVGWWVKGWGGG